MLTLNIQYPQDPEFWQRWFASKVLNPDEWLDTAENLTAVLKLLSPQIDSAFAGIAKAVTAGAGERIEGSDVFRIHGVYLMLSAYAIENCVKGALVRKRKWCAEDVSKGLPQELKSHTLGALVEPLELSLNEEEDELLERLAAYSTWAGRYPVPLYRDALRPVGEGVNAGNQLTCARGSDTAVVECLLGKLAEFLRTGNRLPTKHRQKRAFDGVLIQTAVRAS
jgi:hypothetical protein